MESLLKPAKVAELLATDRKTLWQLVDRRLLKPVKLTKHRRGWRFTIENANARY